MAVETLGAAETLCGRIRRGVSAFEDIASRVESLEARLETGEDRLAESEDRERHLTHLLEGGLDGEEWADVSESLRDVKRGIFTLEEVMDRWNIGVSA